MVVHCNINRLHFSCMHQCWGNSFCLIFIFITCINFLYSPLLLIFPVNLRFQRSANPWYRHPLLPSTQYLPVYVISWLCNPTVAHKPWSQFQTQPPGFYHGYAKNLLRIPSCSLFQEMQECFQREHQSTLKTLQGPSNIGHKAEE